MESTITAYAHVVIFYDVANEEDQNIVKLHLTSLSLLLLVFGGSKDLGVGRIVSQIMYFETSLLR